ncbi:MAG: fumarate hydratase, partial [Oscillospiraceae bacterium]
MREIKASQIKDITRDLCIESNINLPCDVREEIEKSRKLETFETAKNVLDRIIENYEIAASEKVPICQDTGMVCVFLEIGREVYIDGNIEDAVNLGVKEGYDLGYLRKSVVDDPIRRVNTKDNTPACIYYEIIEGDKVKITVAPKGFGSENMSQLKMLKPSDGVEGIKEFVLKVVKEAGPNACPPIVVGVGIGGNFDKAAFLSKKALMRP